MEKKYIKMFNVCSFKKLGIILNIGEGKEKLGQLYSAGRNVMFSRATLINSLLFLKKSNMPLSYNLAVITPRHLSRK